MSLFYPDSLWRFVPSGIDQLDSQVQRSMVDQSSSFWKSIEMISDTNVGIFFSIIFLFFVWLYSGERSKQRWLLGIKYCIVLIIFLLISDFIAHKLLKIPIGRLKPRVNGIIPGMYQPLSFPSSHAFNLAFFLMLINFTIRDHLLFKFLKYKMYFFSLATFVVLVSVSRIILNEHYPLDILGGWILGALLAVILYRPFVRLLKLVQ
jgi:membrane-associated phospholipid phosphatase